MAALTSDTDYRDLVNRLMLHGWYRVGQGPAYDQDRKQWGFQEGHLREDPSVKPLWIPACDECSAMRILLREVERAQRGRSHPPTPASTDPRTLVDGREHGSRYPAAP